MFQPTGEHSNAEEWTEDTGQETKLATPRREEGDLTRQHRDISHAVANVMTAT